MSAVAAATSSMDTVPGYRTRLLVFGLTGRPLAGKQKVVRKATAQLHEAGIRVKTVFFTTRLQAMACALGLDPSMYGDARKDEPEPCLQGPTPRTLLDTLEVSMRPLLGDMFIRTVRGELFNAQAAARAEPATTTVVIIPDVKFEREANFLRREWGAQIYRVVGAGERVTTSTLAPRQLRTDIDRLPVDGAIITNASEPDFCSSVQCRITELALQARAAATQT